MKNIKKKEKTHPKEPTCRESWWRFWLGGGILVASAEIIGNACIGHFPILLPVALGSPFFSIFLNAVIYGAIFLFVGLVIGTVIELLRRPLRIGGDIHRIIAIVLLIGAVVYLWYGNYASKLGNIDPSQGLPEGYHPPLSLWWWGIGLVMVVVVIIITGFVTGFFRDRKRVLLWLIALISAVEAFNIADYSVGADFLRYWLMGIIWLIAIGSTMVLMRYKVAARQVVAVVGLIAVIVIIAQGIYFGWPGKNYDHHLTLLIWDAQRADRMGVYSNKYARTPVLSSLADRMIKFDRAYSPANYTYASTVSLFTGRYLREHHLYSGTIADIALYDTFENLAGDMGRKGYRPVLLTESPWLVTLKRGFEEVISYPTRRGTFSSFLSFDRTSFVGVQIIDHLSFLRDGLFKSTLVRMQDRYLTGLLLRARREGPYFFYVCWMNAHSRYYPGCIGLRSTSPAALRTMPESEYLRAIEYMDSRLGVWIEMMKGAGQWGQALTILTADHGEFLGEFDMVGHGKALLEPVLHVPLLLFGSKAVRGIIDQPVPLVALRKAIAALVPGDRGEWDTEAFVREMVNNRGMVVEGSFDFEGPDDSIRWFLAAWEGEMKYMQDTHRYIPDHSEGLDMDSFYFYYNLTEDPGELHNLAPDRPDGVARMQALISEWESGLDPAPLPPPEDEEEGEYPPGLVEQMKALGYDL
ncbi:MAG: sulfatase-like hydrolase/transferase [Candidatus Euphemobacter frigidus]|nr:sulfatase-like hydrolase/transferase [Candidatus Euphemobacter frigidus]